MKLLPANIEKFIEKPYDNVKAILIYGPNSGLVTIYSDKLVKNLLGDSQNFFNLSVTDYDKVKNNPSELKIMLSSINLLSSKKVIKIINVSNNFNSELRDLLSNIKNNIVIMVGGELPANSSIRKFFETDINSVSIACYVEEEADLKKFIINYLKNRSYNLSIDAINIISELITGDRLYIQNELDKLILYMANRRIINVEDIKSIISISTNFSLEEFCSQVICKEINSIDILNNLIEENINIVSIIRSLSRYFIRLYQIKEEVENGLILKNVINSLSPPLFYKQIPIFTKALQLWSLEDLNKIIVHLVELEIKSKKTDNLIYLVFNDFLIRIIAT